MKMNKFNVVILDVNEHSHIYQVETEESREDIMYNVNKAWKKKVGIKINYYKGKEPGNVIFDSRKVISVEVSDIKDNETQLLLNEMIKNQRED